MIILKQIYSKNTDKIATIRSLCVERMKVEISNCWFWYMDEKNEVLTGAKLVLIQNQTEQDNY